MAKASFTGKGMQPVFLLDFAVYKAPDCFKAAMFEAYERNVELGLFPQDQAEFMLRVAERSGLGFNATYWPPAINPMVNPILRNDMATAMVEAEMVMCGAVQELLDRTGIRPEQIDILVTTCSIFCPTPSLASMLVTKFGLRSDIQSYHLGGMGCSNGVVGVGLVRDLLQARPNSIALFVPAEITTYPFYTGRDKAYSVANALFRMGGAAALLTNKQAHARSAKYELQCSVRVHTGQSEESYGCMSWGPDSDGINGIRLGKNVPKCAAAALMACLECVAPHIMTWGQWLSAIGNWGASRLTTNVERYKPDFTQCVDHFALHAGSYAVLKALQKGMQLPAHHLLPNFAALRDYGNTSSSTTWYTLAYLESVVGVKRGARIMQVGLGGGMKAGVNIWTACRNNQHSHGAWAHLNGTPIKPDDLPRALDELDPVQTKAAAAAKATAQAQAAAAAAARRAKAAAAAVLPLVPPGLIPQRPTPPAPHGPTP